MAACRAAKRSLASSNGASPCFHIACAQRAQESHFRAQKNRCAMATAMRSMKLTDLADLTDTALLESLKQLVMQEQQCTAKVVAHLVEVDARKAYLPWASSLFVYATEHLHLSEGAAYKRITTARLVQRFPAVLDALMQGEVHLGALNALASTLNDDNCAELLAAAKHKTTRAVELLVAVRCPKPDVPQTIRKLPMHSPRGELAPQVVQGLLNPPWDLAVSQQVAPPPSNQGAQRATPSAVQLEPLSAERYKVQFTASKALHDKLRLAQQLLAHRVAPADLATIVEAALDKLIDDVMHERFATPRQSRSTTRTTTAPTIEAAFDDAPSSRPQALGNPSVPQTTGSSAARAPAAPPAPAMPQPQAAAAKPAVTSNSRYIPAQVRRQVLARDGLRCTHIDPQGRRCGEVAMLELHHLTPFARGGTHDPSNLAVRCAAHNYYAAEQDYGADRMRRYTHQPFRP